MSEQTAMVRVVFDTSSLVSAALRPLSTPHLALSHALATGTVCASAATLAELDAVMGRSKFDAYQPPEIRFAFAQLVRQHCAIFEVSEDDLTGVSPICRDPKDHIFLALTRVCSASAIITSDADLLVLNPWRSIQIITPAGYLG